MIAFRKFLLFIAAVCVAAFIALQLWTTSEISQQSLEILKQFERTPAGSMAEEKARQEAIATKIQNVRQTVFWSSLLGSLSGAVGVIAGLFGAWITIHQYLALRRKEQTDRAIAELRTIWEGVVSDNSIKRTGSIAALQHYMTRELKEYHGQICSLLALAARLKAGSRADDDVVLLRTLTPVVEFAFRSVDHSILRSISWQGARLYKPNFSKLDLCGFDFRDALLVEADFRGAILRGARIHAATLNGAVFDDANLEQAILEHADLAGASFRRAILCRADLRDVKIQDADIKGADLRGCLFSHRVLDWRLMSNWRSARLEPELFERLIAKYGPDASGPRVMHLSWEIAPFVSGGAWTAIYHLARNLRGRGRTSPCSFRGERVPSQPIRLATKLRWWALESNILGRPRTNIPRTAAIHPRAADRIRPGPNTCPPETFWTKPKHSRGFLPK